MTLNHLLHLFILETKQQSQKQMKTEKTNGAEFHHGSRRRFTEPLPDNKETQAVLTVSLIIDTHIYFLAWCTNFDRCFIDKLMHIFPI